MASHGGVITATDNGNDLINIEDRNEQSFDKMQPFLRTGSSIFRPTPHDLKSVCALRMLERPEIVRGAAVCSASASLPIRSGTRVASDGDVEEHVAKGLTYEEAVAVWGKRGQSEPKPRSREEQTLRNFVMGVSGNGHAIRDYAAML